jgi:hypothetical protein
MEENVNTDIVVTRPAHGRRATSIGIAGAVLIALLLALLSPLGAAKAFAINDQQDINWDLSKGRSGYTQMINDVRSRAEQNPIYGTSTETVWATEADTNDYFFVNVWDGSTELVQLVIRAHDMYVQGYYAPGSSTYYRFRDAALQGTGWLPSSSNSQPTEYALPFDGSYLDMTRYSDQKIQTPTFSTDWARHDAQQLSYTDTADSVRAGALLWFVEAVAEGARFNAISNRISAAWTDSSGYKYDGDDESLVKNWSSIGTNLQQRLDGTNVPPVPAIGRYDFGTIASTAAIVYLVIFWSP